MAESNPANASATGGPKMTRDKLEDMMISLGVAETQQEVWDLVNSIDGRTPGNEELDFEDYLDIVRAKLDTSVSRRVFGAMMRGTLGNPHLNFETVLSEYRRGMIISATGARAPDSRALDETGTTLGATGSACSSPGMSRFPDKSPRRELLEEKETRRQREGLRIMGNFASLQKGRHAQASQEQRLPAASGSEGGGSKDVPDDPSFHHVDGQAPLGRLEWYWNSVVQDYKIKSSRPSSAGAGGGGTPTWGRPPSPTEVVTGLAKGRPRIDKRPTGFGPTAVAFEPGYVSAPQTLLGPLRPLGPL